MAEIINLRQMRKRKMRAERAAEADANRLVHGLSKAEKQKSGAEKTLAKRRLDAVKLTEDTPEE